MILLSRDAGHQQRDDNDDDARNDRSHDRLLGSAYPNMSVLTRRIA